MKSHVLYYPSSFCNGSAKWRNIAEEARIALMMMNKLHAISLYKLITDETNDVEFIPYYKKFAALTWEDYQYNRQVFLKHHLLIHTASALLKIQKLGEPLNDKLEGLRNYILNPHLWQSLSKEDYRSQPYIWRLMLKLFDCYKHFNFQEGQEKIARFVLEHCEDK